MELIQSRSLWLTLKYQRAPSSISGFVLSSNRHIGLMAYVDSRVLMLGTKLYEDYGEPCNRRSVAVVVSFNFRAKCADPLLSHFVYMRTSVMRSSRQDSVKAGDVNSTLVPANTRKSRCLPPEILRLVCCDSTTRHQTNMKFTLPRASQHYNRMDREVNDFDLIPPLSNAPWKKKSVTPFLMTHEIDRPLQSRIAP